MKASTSSSESAGPNFKLDEATISREYERQRPIYKALEEEVVFILEDRISQKNIKIHTIERRVKELPSLLAKCARKRCNDPFAEFVDIAAARVVCLFRSDIERLKQLVADNFDVIGIDDKIQTGNDPLGYLSVHMICKIKSGHSGPRYEKILGKTFEIQLRTLCMHCWAAVSHYVDYKGDWDVPANLKMALSALGGLFYVADSEFEQFNAARLESKKSAEQASASKAESGEINLDTVTALLSNMYSNRRHSEPAVISELVHELKAAGYETIDQVRNDLIAGADDLEDWEALNKKGKVFLLISEPPVKHSRLFHSASTPFGKPSRRRGWKPTRRPREGPNRRCRRT